MRNLVLALACGIGGAAFAHSLDAPHMVYPAEFRVLADTIVGAIWVEGLYIKPSGEPTGYTRVLALMTGHDNTFIGECAGASAFAPNYDLLLGDYTALPTPGTSNFVNIAGKVCWSRDTGLRAACPSPEPDCVARLSVPKPAISPAVPSREASVSPRQPAP